MLSEMVKNILKYAKKCIKKLILSKNDKCGLLNIFYLPPPPSPHLLK